MAPTSFSSALRAAALLSAVVVLAACGDDPSGPGENESEEPAGVVLGTVYAPDRTTFGDLTARIRWGEQDVTNPVNADGSFAVPLVDPVEGFGQLTVEPADGEGLLPAMVLLTPGDLNGQGTVVLLPTSWTLEAGIHEGTTVSIQPALAADTRVMPSFWGFLYPFRQEGFLQTVVDNSHWSGAFRSWPESMYPIPVALDRLGSNAPFTDADSAMLWTHLNRLEAVMGRDLFQPAPVSEIQILGGSRRALDAILIQVDTTQETRGEGANRTPEPWTWSLTADADTWAGGPVQRVGFLSADIEGGRMVVQDPELFEDQRLVIHEMMHVLGLGHGCSWPSVMTYCASLATDEPTAQDIAHFEVLETIRRMEDELDTRWGLLASVFGHRVVSLGLTPVPGPNLVYGPGSVSGR